MPTFIRPCKELLGTYQGRLHMLLIVSRPHTSNELVFALTQTIPALLVVVHSRREVLEVTESIRPDAFVLESVFLDEFSEFESYDRLREQLEFSNIPAILIGTLSSEQSCLMAKREMVNLPYPVKPHDLQSALETLLHMPVRRPHTRVIVEHKSPSLA